MRLKRKASQLATRSSRLCIEGFPRSGNTYAMACLLEIPGLSREHIAHHTHNFANVRRALSLDLPTYIVLRDPLDASLSLSVMGLATVEDALRAWLDFHAPISQRAGGRLVLVPFEVLSADPYSLVATAATAIGLAPPEENADFAAALLQRRRNADKAWAKPASHGSAPDPERNKAKDALAQWGLDRMAQRNLERARELRGALLSCPSTIAARSGGEASPAAA